MYGTVARLCITPGAFDKFAHLVQEFTTLNVPGFVTTYLYQLDANPNECYMAVIFRDKATYDANAQSAAQNERYQQMRALLTSDPEWHDGTASAFVNPAR